MSSMGKSVTGLLTMVFGLALAGSASAATAKYAGTVRAIDSAKASLVLEDVGPWVGQAESPITPRTVVLSSSTEYFVADRVKDAPAGFSDDYRETRVQLSEVKAGAFVTVECERESAQCTAVKLTVVRPTQP